VNHYNKKEVEVKFENLNDYSVISEEPYGKIINLGEHEGISIFSLTCPNVSVEPIKEKTGELANYIKLLYDTMKESFLDYSENMILYYLYKRTGINQLFSTKDLYELIKKEAVIENLNKEDKDKGMDLLEIPIIDEENLIAIHSEKDRTEFEVIKAKINKGESVLVEEKMYIRSLVGI